MKRNKIKISQLSETKLNKKNLNNLKDIIGYKAHGHPMQIIKTKRSSNGMLTLINKEDIDHIKQCCNYINNKYIMHHITTKYKLMIVSVYVPPFERKDITENTLRIQKIDEIYRDLSNG